MKNVLCITFICYLCHVKKRMNLNNNLNKL